MGYEMDEQEKNFPGKISCFCSCRGNLLLRIILRHFLAEKKVIDARIDLFQ